MKYYVASRVKEKERAAKLIKELEDRGHTVTLDWTQIETLSPYKNNLEQSKHVADQMVRAIQEADIFILFPDSSGGTGMYTELGVALSENKKVFAIGDDIEKPLFMFHPNVIHVSSTDDLLKRL